MAEDDMMLAVCWEGKEKMEVSSGNKLNIAKDGDALRWLPIDELVLTYERHVKFPSRLRDKLLN